jgi:hypothetical protein
MAILDALHKFGIAYNNHDQIKLDHEVIEINREYIWQKNRLNKKHRFASESDLETYILLSLKNENSFEYKTFGEILAKCSGNDLIDSRIYNQFIFGNVYPADIVVITNDSINVFELKRDSLANIVVAQIEKEIRKHLYYSLLSERVVQENVSKIFNFYLVCLYQSNKKSAGIPKA